MHHAPFTKENFIVQLGLQIYAHISVMAYGGGACFCFVYVSLLRR